MLRWFTNLSLLSKVMVPLVLLGLVTATLAANTKIEVDRLSRLTSETINIVATRRALMLDTGKTLAEAAVQLRNIILATRDEDIHAANDALRLKLGRIDDDLQRMEVTSNTDDRRQAVDTLRQRAAVYRTAAERTAASVLSKNKEEALKRLNEEAVPALRSFTEFTDSRVVLLDQQLTEIAQRTEQSAEQTGRNVIIGAAAGLTLCLGLATAIIIVLVVRPLAGMTRSMAELADGHLEISVAGTDRRDEVGSLARSLQVFKTNGLEMRRMQAQEQAAKAAAESERRAMLANLANSFESSVKDVVEAVAAAAAQMESAASSMTDTAHLASMRANTVAAAAEEASVNVNTVAGATEELSASVLEIGRQVSVSTQIAAQAVDDSRKTDDMMVGLADAARRIGEVVNLINDIAAQTNLLALNATIEAARAGEAGKGFAVVAGEVKHLATQTGKATDDIQSKVHEIQGATEHAVTAIRGVGRTIVQMNEITTTIASAVEEQGAATKDIASNIQQAALGTREVSSNIAGVHQATDDTGAAASQVMSAAGALLRQAEKLRHEVASFLQNVRAA